MVLPMVPKAKGRPRMSRKGRAYTPAETRKWEAQCACVLSQHTPAEPLEGPLVLDVLFVFPRPGYMCKKDRHGNLKHDPALIYKPNKPDLSNIIKTLEDAMSIARWWKDDCQVSVGFQLKAYAELGGDARIELMLSEAGDSPEAMWLTTKAQRGSQSL